MLSVSKAIKAGQGEYYLSLAAVDDYYTSGQEPPGYWLGRGTAALGLAGRFEQEEFRHLLRGLSPDGQRKLVRNADAERRAGWDLTWSPPKSVSVAWSQADPVVREQIESCLRRAAAAGIGYLETVGVVSRQGTDGCVRAKADLVFAAFLHSTSRAQDPQLHLHTILLNVGVRVDGTTGTLDPQPLYRHQRAAGALFRAELACALESKLGLRARREGWAFELLGVDPELIEFFSKRRAEIEAELARLGQSGGKAAEMANFATRSQKEACSREVLFAEWQRIGQEHHWSTKELSWIVHAAFPKRDIAVEKADAMAEALAKLTADDSHFSRRQVAQAAAECCQGRGLGAATALTLRDQILQLPEVVELGPHRGEVHYTTKEILALEWAVIATAQAMRDRQEALSNADVMTEVAIAMNPHLSDQQVTALRALCAGRSGITLIHGMAGTGKSTLFATAREIWEQQGLAVHGAALAGKAARGLEEATGIPSTTLHQLLARLNNGSVILGRDAVVVLDEAAMIGSRPLARVVEHCHRTGAALVLCGDARQLQAIEMGGLFYELTARMETARLTEIRRQRDEWARESVQDFAFGRAQRALARYSERGLVTEVPNPVVATDRLLHDWQAELMPGLKDAVILANTTGNANEVNAKAQAMRRRLGQLGDDAVQAGRELLFAGDRVLFTRNSPTLGVCNGDLGIVRSVRGEILTVTLDDNRTVNVSTAQYPHVRLGYALTTHKAQGMTVENSYVLTGGTMTHRELTYVQASRARNATHWYVGHDRDETVRHMTRSHEKVAAIGLAQGPELELKLAL